MTETGPARPPWCGPPAVRSPGQAGSRIDDEVLARISPAHSENINFFGAIEVDIEGELGPTGYWPLRVRDTVL